MRKCIILLTLGIFLSGCATVGPKFYMAISMIEPREIYPAYDQNGYIRFEDENIKIKFIVGEKKIGFNLENKSNGPVKILWDNSAYIDVRNTSHRIMHQGVRYIERDRVQPPTSIAPSTSIDDLILPVDNVVSVYGGGWKTAPLFPALGEEEKNEQFYRGKQFGILMALDINNNIKNYLFKFKIDDVFAPKYFSPTKEGDVYLGIMPYAVYDGILVMHVFPDTSASKANLKKGDKILEINGKVVNSIKTLRDVLKVTKLGEKFDIAVLRNNQREVITIVAEVYKK
ncbi:MAG: PDZ domain-containing protein [Candidatus Ratteibacteria bacterium]|nr:PDZ domain-containing protein [Candidatus Ratteibacteria bacterium]